MALPLCPVCQNAYNTLHFPSIHPCGHGICDICYDKYVSTGGETCPICRVHTSSTSINYDLRSMCAEYRNRVGGEICSVLWGGTCPGKILSSRSVSAKSLHSSGLRCDWCVSSMKEARAVLVDLLEELPLADVLHWITVLNFDQGWRHNSRTRQHVDAA